ncbi:MAG TPA: CARDB domain-containing protein, partial [Thermomicrobiaceae bacterium]|nr:CARDB domain-containing protein [Thermomicrobiaceae bacterium]
TTQFQSLAAGATTTWEFDYTYTRDGTFDTVASVDTTNAVKETNEDNNSKTVTLTVDPPLSDLIVTNVSINPTNPIAGQQAVVTVTVQNVGHRATDVTNPGDFVVQWRPQPLAQPLTQQVNGPLAVGDTATVTFVYTYPSGGSFNSTATVDATFKVQEVHEDNNTDTLQVPVSDATIDLEVTDFSVSPAAPIQGDDTTFSVTVRNNGNTEADNFIIEVNPDAFGITSPSNQSVTLFISSLAAGATQTFSMPAFQYKGTGFVRAIATVDASNNVSETNEANNTKLLNLAVSAGVTDLQVTAFSLATDLCAQSLPPSCSPMKFWKGSAVTATITVQNFGRFPAGSFAVQWRPDNTKTSGPSVQLAGLAAFGHPGDSATVTVTGTFSSDGTFTTSAFVDPFNQVTEPCANCENNNESSTLTLTVLPRDLSLNVTVTDFNVLSSDLDDGPLRGDGDWNMWLLVLAKDQTCHFSFGPVDKDIKGFTCPFHFFGPDGAEDFPNPGWSASVTLAENAPLLFGIFGVEDDLPTGVDKPGAAFKFFLPGDFSTGGTFLLKGQKGDGRCNNGECFDATVQVTITAGPPPPAKVGAIVPSMRMFDALRQFNDAADSFNQITP